MRLEKIEKLINDGVNLDIIKDGLKTYYENEDFINWKANQQIEYDALFKTKQVLVERLDDENNVITDSEFIYIDERVSFDDWLQETKIVQDAVIEDDVVVQEEIRELIRPYVKSDVTELVDSYLAPFLKEKILKEIESLESQALRPTRELLIDSTNEYAKNKLVEIETQIASLRLQLK